MTGASNIENDTLVINRWTPQPKNISHLGELLLVCKGSGYGKTVINTVGDVHIARQFMSITPYMGISIDYINLFLKAKLKEIKKNGQGVIPGIDRGSVLNLMFPVPSAKEQPRIIEKYKSFDAKIDDYDLQYNALEEINATMPQKLKSSILQYAIQGKLVPQDPNDEPASVLLERIRAEKEQMIKNGKIKRDKNESYIYRGSDNSYYEVQNGKTVCINDILPFTIPDSWTWCRLGTIIEIARGGSPRPIKEYITTSKRGVNWIKIGDTDKNGKYIDSTAERIIPEGIAKSRMVHKGDFLLTNSMSFGRPYILNIDGCIHDGWLVFTNYEKCFNQEFLYYMLSSYYAYNQFRSKVSGAVVKNLNIDKVVSALFPLPPLCEQVRIAKKIKRSDACLLG